MVALQEALPNDQAAAPVTAPVLEIRVRFSKREAGETRSQKRLLTHYAARFDVARGGRFTDQEGDT